MGAYIIESDGSARDHEGRPIFFAFERFKAEICKKGHCFVCGAPPNRTFNKEHVFPNWMLRLCGIQNDTLTLPTGKQVKYGTYKIPCCKDCNTLLGNIFETPISEAVRGGYDSTLEYATNGGGNALRQWLALIFLKVHLRDFRNRISSDEREPEVIGEGYDLSDLHHIHAVARAATACVDIEPDVFGTLLILKVDPSHMQSGFDYCDNLAGRALLLRVKDLALIYVLDDCGGTGSMLSEALQVLPAAMTEIQLREVFARHLAANLHIRHRPVFRTDFNGHSGRPRIAVTLPEFEHHDYRPEIFGQMFAGVLGSLADNISVDGMIGKDALDIVATGRVTFLFDKDGRVLGGSA